MVLEFVAVVLLGGVAELDRTSVFHGMFSEPIVLAPIAGLILGEPMLGLKVGVILQLFFLGSVSMGGSSPPDAAMASVAVTASAAIAAAFTQTPSDVALAVAVLGVMVPAGWLGKVIDTKLKERNVHLLYKAEEGIEKLGIKAVERAVHYSLGRTFLVFGVGMAIASGAAAVVVAVALNYMPSEWWGALKVTGSLLLLASAGIALASLRERRAIWVYSVLGVALVVLLVGVA